MPHCPGGIAVNLPMSRRCACVLAGMGLGLGALGPAAAATPGVDEPPPPQPQRALVLPAFDSFRLANGLDVVVVQRPALPVVTLSLLVRAGPEADPPGRPGVAAMTAALWSKGARRAGPPEGEQANLGRPGVCL